MTMITPSLRCTAHVATSTSRALYMSAVATYAYRWRQLQAAAICILGLLIFRSIRSRLTLTTGTSRTIASMRKFKALISIARRSVMMIIAIGSIYRARVIITSGRRPMAIRIHWPSFYNVVTGKTLALPNLIALQHIPLSPAGVIAKRPAPIALPNSCAA
nr:non-functional lacZ alpha peptide [unidentified cloning vector]